MTDTAAYDPHPPTTGLATATAAQIAGELASGRTTSTELVTALLERIRVVDGPGDLHLAAVLATAPDALEQAARLDAERAAGAVRGPLHGVPVLVKDNIETVGLPGTAGSLALAGRAVVRDAPLVAALRAAGLLVLGATNLSEWANLRSPASTSGWSAVGGLTGNPWALDRSAGGSSSGSGAAVAAGLAPLAIGTETDGSIVCPSSFNGCVGLKPTVGLVPTEGVVPLSASQDSPGPMGRTVADVALLLDALTGGSAYGDAPGSVAIGDVQLGVAGAWLTGHDATDTHFTETLQLLEESGVLLTPVDVPAADAEVELCELHVLLCETRDGLDAYLASRAGEGVRSLDDVVDFNVEHADEELAHFGQEHFERALGTDGTADADYPAARAACGDDNEISRPEMRIRPPSGLITPEAIFASVDFPAPLAPISATTSPRGMARSTSSSACVAPNRFDSEMRESAGASVQDNKHRSKCRSARQCLPSPQALERALKEVKIILLVL